MPCSWRRLGQSGGQGANAQPYNQRYPTFARFIGANFAYAQLHIYLGQNLQHIAPKSSLDIGKILS